MTNGPGHLGQVGAKLPQGEAILAILAMWRKQAIFSCQNDAGSREIRRNKTLSIRTAHSFAPH